MFYLFIYLKSHNYSLSVGRIGNLECDFIARRGIDKYFYLQVAKNVQEEKAFKREYRPFYEIKEMYPRYLFLADIILQENIDGINNVNIVDFIYENREL
jgi:AAA+ superfamily ATPase